MSNYRWVQCRKCSNRNSPNENATSICVLAPQLEWVLVLARYGRLEFRLSLAAYVGLL
jgi:hypothetical protein